MEILLIGVNHKTAPVRVRESLTIPEQKLPQMLQAFSQTKSVFESVVLSTCNRTEWYVVVDHVHRGRDHIKRFLSDWFGMERKTLDHYLYVKENAQAVAHLFRVVCGLDSMVLGETQILGQVKQAFFHAQEQQATGTIFNTLFKQAVTFAKRVHNETEIGENAVSVSYAAIELGKKIFGQFDRKSVLVIGAGKMSELTAVHLHANGVKEVTVANRSYDRAAELAGKFDGKAVTLDDLSEALVRADIVISSTGADGYVLTKPQLVDVLKKRHHRPLFMIDIAVPRDLDPAINELDNVFLYDIDDLEGIVDSNLEVRKRESEKVLSWIGEEVTAFQQWLDTLGVVPLISSLRQKAMRIQEETMRSIENKLPDLTERERKVLRKHTKSIVNQMLKDPILRIKEMASEPDADEYLAVFERIFALEEETAEGGESALYAGEQGKEPGKSHRSKHVPIRS